MAQPDTTGSPPLSRILSVLVVVGGIAGGALGYLLFAVHAPLTAGEVVGKELAGGGQVLPLGSVFVTAVRWDFVFITGYGLALAAGTWAAGQVCWTPRACTVARFGMGAAAVAVVADCLENMLILVATDNEGNVIPGRTALLDAAAGMATLKFSAVVPAALVALFGAAVLVARAIGNRPTTLATAANALGPSGTKPCAYLPARTEGDSVSPIAATRFPPVHLAATAGSGGERTKWCNGYDVPDVNPAEIGRQHLAGRPTIGFCLSGGGIRAASVALGALQALRADLEKAKYLVSVSGGGFTAGAMSLALAPSQPRHGALVTPEPGSLFADGSAEADHLRRHSSYIADSPTDMLIALGLVLRGLLASLALLFAPAVIVGAALSLFYGHVPVAHLSGIPSDGKVPPFPTVLVGVWVALAVPAGLAVVAWLAQMTFEMFEKPRSVGPRTGRAVPVLRHTATLLFGLTLLVFVMTVGIPVVQWASAWVLAQAAGSGGLVHVGGPIGTVVLTYLAALGAMVWRNRQVITTAVSGAGKKDKNSFSGVMAALPRGPVQYLLVCLTLLLLAAGWLLLAGGVATLDDAQSLRVAGLVGGALLLVGGALDQSSLSLHPFYRRRLASAIAVRRVRDADATIAESFDWDEATPLSSHAHRSSHGLPTVIFAAAANLTDEHRTPPGLTTVPFTMSADWVGGPDVGWIRTKNLEDASTPRLQHDLTVEAAVAISGAAFASAMGRHAAWYQTLLAVTGARLGAWLPNPAFVIRRTTAATERDWRIPGLPRVRRLTYLVREILGIHHIDDRLLHVTDGGHYENLGLVELLRRRCTLIYCIDASGDAPPSAKTLAEAITLARAELGVQVELDEPWRLEPGTGAPLNAAEVLTALNGRLSESPVVTGTIHYPTESGLPPRTIGRLVVAKALLDKDAPYSVLAHAAGSPIFPHDGTSDQFFDHEQFQAYTELGRHIGKLAAERTRTRRAQTTSVEICMVEIPTAPSSGLTIATSGTMIGRQHNDT